MKAHSLCAAVAGIDLTFFTVSGIGLCYRFMLYTVMIIETFLLLLSSAYTEPRPLLLLLLPCWQGSWKCMENWEETQPEQVVQTDQRDIPDNMTSCLLYKVGGEGGEGDV